MSSNTAYTLADAVLDELGIKDEFEPAYIARLRQSYPFVPEDESQRRNAISQFLQQEAIVHAKLVNALVRETGPLNGLRKDTTMVVVEEGNRHPGLDHFGK